MPLYLNHLFWFEKYYEISTRLLSLLFTVYYNRYSILIVYFLLPDFVVSEESFSGIQTEKLRPIYPSVLLHVSFHLSATLAVIEQRQRRNHQMGKVSISQPQMISLNKMQREQWTATREP